MDAATALREVRRTRRGPCEMLRLAAARGLRRWTRREAPRPGAVLGSTPTARCRRTPRPPSWFPGAGGTAATLVSNRSTNAGQFPTPSRSYGARDSDKTPEAGPRSRYSTDDRAVIGDRTEQVI